MTYHPREGWSEDGTRRPHRGLTADVPGRRHRHRAGRGPGRLRVERERRRNRRRRRQPLALPRPNDPVTWPVYSSNPAIAGGLEPEKNATLKLYNWVAYVNQKDLDAFGKKYNCKVELTTFNTMTEAMAKLRSGEFDFDVFVPTVDVLGQLVAAKLVRPLNPTYIPNISQAWSQYTNPFYDQKWQYTVPYTIYTTGIAWRKDHVPGGPVPPWPTPGPSPGSPSTRERWPFSTTTARASPSG